MATGYASNAVAGMVVLNAAQAASQVAVAPAAVLDDAVTGAVVTHLTGHGTAPTAAVVAAGVGTGGSPAATLATGSTDLCGQIAIKDGTSGWGAGAQATITFGTPFGKAAFPVITAVDSATAALVGTVKPYAVQTSDLTGWQVCFQVADSSTQHTFTFNYFIGGN